MCQALVLATPNFTKTIIVECDVSGNGIGDVLIQEEKPISFESHLIKGKYLHRAIYEKEMSAILHALKIYNKIPVHLIHLAGNMIRYGTRIGYTYVRLSNLNKRLLGNRTSLP